MTPSNGLPPDRAPTRRAIDRLLPTESVTKTRSTKSRTLRATHRPRPCNVAPLIPDIDGARDLRFGRRDLLANFQSAAKP